MLCVFYEVAAMQPHALLQAIQVVLKEQVLPFLGLQAKQQQQQQQQQKQAKADQEAARSGQAAPGGGAVSSNTAITALRELPLGFETGSEYIQLQQIYMLWQK